MGWQGTVSARTYKDSSCPFCSGHRVAPERSVATLHPELAAEWHPTMNGTLGPGDVLPGSNRQVWWRCTVDPQHEWAEKLNTRTSRGTGCPYCSRRRVTPERTLAVLFPQVAALWHPERNGDLTPLQVLASAYLRCWWRCAAGHTWQAAVHERTVMGRGCPACARGS
jgi:hypothetical protein